MQRTERCKIFKSTENKRTKSKRWEVFGRGVVIFVSSLPVLFYAVIVLLSVFMDEKSVIASILLMTFSFVVTITFETNEWLKYIYKKKNNLNDVALIAFGVSIAVGILMSGCCRIFKWSEDLVGLLSNIMTGGALLIYFVSYTIREVLFNLHDVEDDK